MNNSGRHLSAFVFGMLWCCSLFFTNTCFATIPPQAIPFILDSHLYVKSVLVDTVSVSLIYDTGANMLYLDKDYMSNSSFGKRPFNKGNAKMGGAGNGGAKQIPIIIDPITIKLGNQTITEKITPIINLREILGKQVDGMVGNNGLWKKPLAINYTHSYLLPIDNLTPAMIEGYTKLPAKFVKNMAYITCELNIDSLQTLKGDFLIDLGCGSPIILTNETLNKININGKKQATSYIKNNGVGGDGQEVKFRCEQFSLLDKLENIVVSASYSKKGALSERPYIGIIGNDILRHYDFIIDAPNQAVYARRNTDASVSYQESSTWQMSYIDRTDICEGWIVSRLYQNGKAQQAGFEIDDVIVEINGRNVKTISWEEQRKGLDVKGQTLFKVKKKDGSIKEYTLDISDQII